MVVAGVEDAVLADEVFVVVFEAGELALAVDVEAGFGRDFITKCKVCPFLILCIAIVSESFNIFPAKIKTSCVTVASNFSATFSFN